MRRLLLVVVMLGVLCMGMGGCPEQKGTLAENTAKFVEFMENGEEKSEEALKIATEAMELVNRIVDRADDPTPMPLPTGNDPVVDALKVGTNAAQPYVPYPFNYVLLLIPAVAGWLRAETNRKKREMEEALLIQSLQKLKENDRPAFDKVMEYRDMVGKGLMTAKQFSGYLAGILAIKAKYLPAK